MSPPMESRPGKRAAPEQTGEVRSLSSVPEAEAEGEHPMHEPSAWLRQRIADHITRLQAAGLDPWHPDPVIISPLGTSGPPGSRADRACDRCDAYVPAGQNLYASVLHALPGLLLVGGYCAVCASAELGERVTA